MPIPTQYMKLSESDRANVIKAIGETFNNIDEFKYPNIYQNIQSDESRMAIIENVLDEMFGNLNNMGLEEALNSVEITLSQAE